MKYADEMRRARNIVQDCYMQYNEIRQKRPEAFIAFFEGYDAPYYLPVIASIVGSDPEQVICHQKRKVIAVYESLVNKKVLKMEKTGFFVDRDFDINSTLIKDIQNFYVTEGYSIENYYCSKEAFERILKCHMHYNCAHKDYDALVANYLELQRQFNLAILDFNAYYCSIRRNKTIVAWSLKDNVSSEYVEIDFNNLCVNKKYKMADIHRDYPSSPCPSNEEMRRQASWIKQEPVKNLRGKYELYFLVKYLQALEKMVNDPSTAFEEHPMKFSMGQKDALLALAQYADKDEALFSYIRRRAA